MNREQMIAWLMLEGWDFAPSTDGLHASARRGLRPHPNHTGSLSAELYIVDHESIRYVKDGRVMRGNVGWHTCGDKLLHQLFARITHDANT